MAAPLLTMAYAQVLQYWVENIRLSTLNDYCPLAMSVMELRQHMGGTSPSISEMSSGT